jgi:hypothetical protein
VFKSGIVGSLALPPPPCTVLIFFNHAEARKALIIALQDVQAAAAQKYGRTQKTVLRDYLFGSRFGRSRQALDQSSQAVIAKLQSHTLPGITADKKTALVALRQACIESNETQMDRYTGSFTQKA